MGLLLAGGAQASEFEEYAVKAAYLYHFAKYVEWPPEVFSASMAPLVVCIVGDDPFGTALGVLLGKRVEKHPVELRYLPGATSLEQCHLVFMGRAESGRFKTLLSNIARLPILTVSDITGFAEAGGMIGLIEAEQRIRFNINLSAARQAHLKFSSQLLKLAIIID